MDVRDTENIWCSATVELKILSAGRPPLLYIHYEGWNRKYDEYIYQNSHRLAPSGLYTSRTDIPRYYMCPHTNMMYAHVLENAVQQPQPLIRVEEEGDELEDSVVDEIISEPRVLPAINDNHIILPEGGNGD